MFHSGTQWDFSKAASTLPASAAQGAWQGSRPSPGQVFEPGDRCLVVSVRQKTNTAFCKGWGQRQAAGRDRGKAADTDPGGVAGGLCGAAGGLCGVTHQEQAGCLGREQSRGDKRTLPCLVMAPVCRQERAWCERAGWGRGRTTHWHKRAAGGICTQGWRHTSPGPSRVHISGAIAIWGYSFTQDIEDLAPTKQVL